MISFININLKPIKSQLYQGFIIHSLRIKAIVKEKV